MFDDPIYQVSFAGNVLNDIPGVRINYHDFTELPDRDINMSKIARRDLSIITSAEYSSKPLTILAKICSGGRSDTEATIRQLKSLIQSVNAPVIALQGGLEIRYTATLRTFSTSWIGAATANVVIGLIASDPIGYETSETELLDVNTTASTANFSQVVEGSYTIQPTFTVTINDLTDGTAKLVTVRNSKTGQGISVTRDWSDGDILYINSATKEITVNGDPVDFTGLFPTFSTGTQIVGYVDTFDDRDVDIIGTYVKRVI